MYSTAPPTLTPVQQDSVSVLPPTGSSSDVTALTPLGVYTAGPLASTDYLVGAADQVAYTYNKLAGNQLDIELGVSNIYAFYEMATLEYSYIVNMHQAENSLNSYLGSLTSSFDQDGNIKAGTLSSSLGGVNPSLVYPKYDFGYSRQIWKGIAEEVVLNGAHDLYSASVDAIPNQQDYDLQAAVEALPQFTGSVGTKRIRITKVYYKSARASWRFYGYYGGLAGVGGMGMGMGGFGQYANNSDFQMAPVWENKLQAIQYENTISTRLSHFSYELHNNKLRIYPTPQSNYYGVSKIWFKFTIPEDGPWDNLAEDPSLTGVNNFNTLPFPNISYESINSMGKDWIRNFAFYLSLETLGYVRSKFSTIPIPNQPLTLNGPELLRIGKEEQVRLRDQLKVYLDKMTYSELMNKQSEMSEKNQGIITKIPLPIYVK
jgi:hypothetical protein